MVYEFLSKSFAQETVWNWAKDNWDWIKAALGGDMSFDSFVNIPAGILKHKNVLINILLSSSHKQVIKP